VSPPWLASTGSGCDIRPQQPCPDRLV
jgi:hypothetical protein